jgi:hypothetical protein
MVTPNTEMQRSDLVSLVATANACTALAHRPFILFNPASALGGAYFDLAAPYTVTDRGGWVAGTYNAGDQVTCDGYIFISVVNGNTARPLSATTGDPTSADDWRQIWHSCYQRIRNEVNTASATEVAGLFPLTQWGLSVSGPWPCQNPDINYDHQAFYFEDKGVPVSVSIDADIGGIINGKQVYAESESLADFLGGATLLKTPADFVSGSPDSTFTARVGAPDQYRFRYVSENEFTVVVGGPKPIPINVTFTLGIGFAQGVSVRNPASGGDGPDPQVITRDTASPSSMVAVDTTNWFPGASFTAGAFSGWSSHSGSMTLSCTVNATVDPGIYKVKFTVTGSPNNRASGVMTAHDNGDGTSTWTGFNEWDIDTFSFLQGGLIPSGTMSIVNSDAVDTPGVDDTYPIKKIVISDFSGLGPPILMGGAEYLNYTLDGEAGPILNSSGMVAISESDPSITASLDFEKLISLILIVPGISINTSQPGYWLGQTPPITSLGMIPFEQMPWNKFPTDFPSSGHKTAQKNQYLGYKLPFTGGKAFTNTDPVRAYNSASDAPTWMTTHSDAGELLPWPKRWKALVHYPLGFTILDSNGNFQTLITQDGRSGAAEPTWPGSIGGITSEGSYVDLNGVTQPGAQWQLSELLRSLPTIQRNKAYTVGVRVIDNNGNRQKCTTAGTSHATTAPAWATTVGTTTTDGTVTWTLVRVIPKFHAPVASISPPIYPFFWHNPVTQWQATTKYAKGETITDSAGNIQLSSGGTSGGAQPVWGTTVGATVSDGSITWKCIKLEQPSLTDPNSDSLGHFPFSFAPQGWWIYRVFLNRIPQRKSTEKPDATPISVELGCVRGGVFVSFGTFATGTPVDAMWPVFTNTALAYECAERIDVQAEILTCGLSYGTWGNVHFPMAAAFLNDIETIIGLL